jgi:hypothetical protein
MQLDDRAPLNSYGLRALAWALTSCVALLATSLVGCGNKARLPVNPVHGRVLYKGQGVPRATVVFFPDGDAANLVGNVRPFAYTEADGSFDVKTYVGGDGAPPGDYRVSITTFYASPKRGPVKDALVGEEAPQTFVQIPKPISEKFANIESAGIKITIQEGENNLDPFELGAASASKASASIIN